MCETKLVYAYERTTVARKNVWTQLKVKYSKSDMHRPLALRCVPSRLSGLYTVWCNPLSQEDQTRARIPPPEMNGIARERLTTRLQIVSATPSCRSMRRVVRSCRCRVERPAPRFCGASWCLCRELARLHWLCDMLSQKMHAAKH